MHSITERAKALGWADELSKMNPFDGLVDDPYIEKTCQKEITDRGNFFQFAQCYLFSQALAVFLHVDNFINTFMQATKAKRLREERVTTLEKRLPILRKLYDACISTYPVNSIIPSSADVFLDPFVQNLIITPPLTAPFTDEDLAAVGTTFPDIVFRWRKQTEEKLLHMITRGYGLQNAAESALQLATTVFTCKFCSEPLTYPRVLIHNCATKMFYYHERTGDEDLPSLRRFLQSTYWNHDNIITFDAKEIVPLIEVIELCGLDPKSATAKDMDKHNAIFECLSCNDVRKGRCTLSWLGVVRLY